MRTALVLLLATAVIAAPAAQAFACRCEAEAAAREAASARSCCCDDAATCHCCPDHQGDRPARMAGKCGCSKTGPWSENQTAEPMPVLSVTVAFATHPADGLVHRATRSTETSAGTARPQVALPLLI